MDKKIAFLGALLGALTGVASGAAPSRTNTDRIEVSVGASEERAIKVIGLWLRAYRRGNYDLSTGAARGFRGPGRGGPGRAGPVRGGSVGRGASARPKEFLIEKHKLLPEGFSGVLTHRQEIDLLCRQARGERSEAAARAILEVAAVGLDRKLKYTSAMAPTEVRAIGERHLRRMRSATVTAYLAKAAAGRGGGPSRFKAAMQAAALRGLGRRRSKVHRSVMEAQLAASRPVVRACAAHALGSLYVADAIEALALRLPREGDATVLIEILDAIERIRFANKDVAITSMQKAVIEAGRALGRADSWPPDLAIVDFLEKFRYRDSIPLLIALLERYEKQPHRVRSGRLPPRLRIRAHQVLSSLTGARIPMEAPDQWREFWEQNKDQFKLPPAPKSQAIAAGGTQGFFNIPVQGKRVVFVIDVSGSMASPMLTSSGPTRAAGSRGEPKIEVAKRELWKAVKSLPVDVRFNVIHYSTNVGQWQRGGELVRATEPTKQKFKRWLDQLRPRGGTNIHDAMAQALKLKSALVYGQRYASSVDEVFLLSDGLPTSGEVTDPAEILRIITTTNRFSRVRINTIYLENNMGRGMRGGRVVVRRGGVGGMSGAELMKQMAERNNGKFVKP